MFARRSLLFLAALWAASLAQAAHWDERKRENETAIFDTKLVGEFSVSPNLVGKKEFPKELPFAEDRQTEKLDLVKLENTDRRWTPEIQAFWAPKVHFLQRELKALTDAHPELRSGLPLPLSVLGIGDVSEQQSDLVPADFVSPEALRFKLVRMLLQRQDSAFLASAKRNFAYPALRDGDFTPVPEGQNEWNSFVARAFVLASSANQPTSRFHVTPGLHWNATHIGEYNARFRAAKRLEATSAESYREAVDAARLHAIAVSFYQMQNAPSWEGVDDVVASFFVDFAKRAKNPKLLEAWATYLLKSRNDPQIFKAFAYADNGDKFALSRSRAKLLEGFSETLPKEQRALFHSLRREYGLTPAVLDEAHLALRPQGRAGEWGDLLATDRDAHRPQVKSDGRFERPIPTEMPTLGGWKIAPEKTAEIPNRSHTYTVDRDFADYARTFPVEFLEALKTMGKTGHWIDAGSGDGFALEGYFAEKVPQDEKSLHSQQEAETAARNERRVKLFREIVEAPVAQRGHVTGVTLQSNRKNPSFDGKLRVLKDRFFEDVSDKELGQADVITDMFGVLSYATHIDDVLHKYLRLLKPGGKIFAQVGNQKLYVKTKSGKELSLRDWLGQLPGIEVQRFGEMDKRFSVSRKANAPLPQFKLKLVYSDGQSPPKRVYVEE